MLKFTLHKKDGHARRGTLELNHGKIEQTGSAEAIYRKPENAFVTEFLGETDAFEGRIEKGIWHYNGFAWKLDTHYKWQEQTATG